MSAPERSRAERYISKNEKLISRKIATIHLLLFCCFELLVGQSSDWVRGRRGISVKRESGAGQGQTIII